MQTTLLLGVEDRDCLLGVLQRQHDARQRDRVGIDHRKKAGEERYWENPRREDADHIRSCAGTGRCVEENEECCGVLQIRHSGERTQQGNSARQR